MAQGPVSDGNTWNQFEQGQPGFTLPYKLCLSWDCFCPDLCSVRFALKGPWFLCLCNRGFHVTWSCHLVCKSYVWSPNSFYMDFFCSGNFPHKETYLLLVETSTWLPTLWLGSGLSQSHSPEMLLLRWGHPEEPSVVATWTALWRLRGWGRMMGEGGRGRGGEKRCWEKFF